MAQLFLSAAHKSSGKTTLSIGLCAAFRNMGKSVQAFKKGPDYIDPLWLGQASERPCYNLDFFTQSHEEIIELHASRASQSDISIIEGNKGLYDGVALDGSDSNAALAKLLGVPVVLVIDTQGITRSVAPILQGFKAFDRDVQIAGVIFNKVGGSRHESKLRQVVETYTDIPVLGAVQWDPDLTIAERHLGLMPSNEMEGASKIISRTEKAIQEQVDLPLLMELAQKTPCPQAMDNNNPMPGPINLRIGIATDAAFGFYYQDDLEEFRAQGAELIPINTLKDKKLPEIDGLFIGGGFPETHLQTLSDNKTLRTELRNAIEGGLPTYAECGGLMYLAQSIRWDDQQADMVGIIPGDVVMHKRPVGRGYVILKEQQNSPWPNHDQTSSVIHAHEFHYSGLENLSVSPDFAYKVTRGEGILEKQDGLIYKNLLATYVHQRHVKANPWVKRFVDFVRLWSNA